MTCTRCVGTWTAAGLLTCQAIAPRFGQLLTWSLAVGAGNDFLQAGFAALIARELPETHDRCQLDEAPRVVAEAGMPRSAP